MKLGKKTKEQKKGAELKLAKKPIGTLQKKGTELLKKANFNVRNNKKVKSFLKNKLIKKIKKKLDATAKRINSFFEKNLKLETEQAGLGPIKIGLYVTAAFFLIFFVWGGLAPINSASIAPGVVVLDFNRKTIQHLEGGIIEEILVKEGDEVVTDSPLVILQNIQAQAQQSIVQKQLLSFNAIKTRLNAEKDYENKFDLEKIKIEGEVLKSEELEEIISGQEGIYKIRKQAYFGKIDILKNKKGQLKEEIKALKAQKNATDRQLKILNRQIEMVKKMVAVQNAPLTDQLNLEKSIAELEGQRGNLSATISKSKQAILETELEIVNFQKEHLTAILEELQKTEAEVASLTEQISSTSDILKRTVIKAPVSGMVMNLKFHTRGAVVPPGGEILQVVPQDEELIIEARINPRDIDMVKKGLRAKINLSAFKAKKVPKLDGKVKSVSADILVDEQTGESYFLGRIVIEKESLKKLRTGIKLYPGMPAETFIIIGSRSFLNYMISPIKDAAYKAIRED
jgi:HlyD family secretion protein